jgi:RNA polymerase sigma-70 factor (ECF subfamily)
MLKQRILSIVRHREDAEDVLQETLLSVYRHLNSFRGKSRFSTWIMKIGINTSITFLRKRKTVFKHTSDVVTENGERFETPEFRDPQPNPEQLYMMRQTLQRVRHAIRKLPPGLHGVVDLYCRRDRSVKDAAKTLGITEDVAKSRMLRARRLLRRSLRIRSFRDEEPGCRR